MSTSLLLAGAATVSLIGAASPASAGVTIAARVDGADTPRYWGADAIHAGRAVFSRLEIYAAEAKAVHLRVSITADEPIHTDDELVLTIRELFSGETAIVRLALPAGDAREYAVELARDQIPFRDGAYHILVDLHRNGKSLAGKNVGSVLYMLADRTRSLGYVSATYQIAYIHFMLDAETGSTPNLFPKPGRLPPTYDPHDPDTRQAWLDLLLAPLLSSDRESWRKAAEEARIRDASIAAELVADGGTGILFGMMAYRAVGERDRERFAFRVLDGFVNGRIRAGKSVPHVNQSWHVVRLLSYACILLNDIPEYRAWVDATLDEIIPLQLKDTVTYDPAVGGTVRGPMPTFAHKTIVVDGQPLTREPYRDGTYVGRVYGGHAWYQMAHLVIRGSEAPTLAEPIDRIIEFAVDESRWLIENDDARGRYGNMCGSINLCFGLVPAYHFAVRAGRDEDADTIAEGLRLALMAATIEPKYGPHFEGWLTADGYTLCEMAIRILGEDERIRRAQFRFTSDADPDIAVPGQAARNEPYGMGHRAATIAPMLLSSPEHAAAIAGGALSWSDSLPPE